MSEHAPVITIDGPSGSGKGTLRQLLARQLQWHMLDSGAIYRMLALAALRENIAVDDEIALVELAKTISIEFTENADYRIQDLLNKEDVTDAIRTVECAQMASKTSALAAVRQALLQKQRKFCQMPGLVTDGRDMGTVVFPQAELKIFLLASVEERAQRRYKQLKNKGENVNLSRILDELSERDIRDRNRSVSPLQPAEDALILDSDGKGIEEVLAIAMDWVDQRGLARKD